MIQAGKVLMVLLPDAAREIELYPDERSLGSLALGLKARVSADAFADQNFEAKVSYIAAAVDPDRGTIEVRLTVQDAPAYLRPEMTVSVDIALGQKRGALSVPTDAVHDATGPHPYVLAVDGDRIVTRRVRLGLRSDTRVELLSGVQVEERVVTDPSLSLSDGQRVRAQD